MPGSTVAWANTVSVQDMPPPGGYPKVNISRGIRNRGPPGWLIWASVFGFSAYGFYQIGVTNDQMRLLNKEKRDSRMAILPFLQAEKDAALGVQIAESRAKEAEIMKNVPGWVVGESSSGQRWNRPLLHDQYKSIKRWEKTLNYFGVDYFNPFAGLFTK